MFWLGPPLDAPALRPAASFRAAEVRQTDADEIDPAALAAWLAEAREEQGNPPDVFNHRGRLNRLL